MHRPAPEAELEACVQGMHEVAFTGGLARPLIAPEDVLKGLSADKLADFVARHYTAPQITLAGAGVTLVRRSLCVSQSQ